MAKSIVTEERRCYLEQKQNREVFSVQVEKFTKHHQTSPNSHGFGIMEVVTNHFFSTIKPATSYPKHMSVTNSSMLQDKRIC